MPKKTPLKETLNLFSDIKSFINKSRSKENIKQSLQMREKQKMPFKMYKGIKAAVIKKHNKFKEENKSNNIFGQTMLKEQKLMTKVIEKRLEDEDADKMKKKLRFSHGKTKARFKNGVMSIGKSFIKNLSSNNKSNGNKINKKK